MKKGFTLVELLAVIVILAILVLLATPAVTSMMTNSAKNSFKSELVGFSKDLDKAYTDKIAYKNNEGKKIQSVDAEYEEGKIHSYKYLCMTLNDLVSEQYSKKELNKYQGYIQTWVPQGEGEAITFIHATDGKYILDARLDELDKSEDLVRLLGEGETYSYDCPDNITVIPSASTYVNEPSNPNPDPVDPDPVDPDPVDPDPVDPDPVDPDPVDPDPVDPPTPSGNVNMAQYLRGLPENNTSVVQNDLTGHSNMRFIGQNPNNYILFGCSDEDNPTIDTCEMWRIIGVFNNNTHNDNNDLVKITKAEPLPAIMYDNRNTSGLNYYGGSNIQKVLKASPYTYVNSNIAKSVKWKVGTLSGSDAGSEGAALKAYVTERNGSTSTANQFQTTWTGVVGLPYISDYAFATSGGDAQTRNACITQYALSIDSNQYWNTLKTTSRGVCTTNSWMLEISKTSAKVLWSMTATKDGYNSIWRVEYNAAKGLGASSTRKTDVLTLPALYLKENVVCTNCSESGVGSISNPYKVILE